MVGVVRPGGSTLTAPLSGRACVAYWLRIEAKPPAEEVEKEPEFRRGFRQVHSEQKMVRFELTVGDASVVVPATDKLVTVLVESAFLEESPSLDVDASAKLAGLRKKHPQIGKGWTMRAHEAVVTVGSRVAVMGRAQRGDVEADSGDEERSSQDDALELRPPSPREPLHVGDFPEFL